MKKLTLFAALFALGLSAATVRQFTPASGDPFSAGVGGKLVQVTVFSTEAAGTVNLASVWSAPTYTNAIDIAVTTSTVWAVEYSNTVTHAVFTNRVDFMPFPVQVYCDVIGSNATVTVTAVTNTTPVQSGVVTVTNAIISGGSCVSGVYSGAPASNTWISGTDALIFTGTAKGGFLRLVIE